MPQGHSYARLTGQGTSGIGTAALGLPGAKPGPISHRIEHDGGSWVFVCKRKE